MTADLISVIIPNWNGAPHLPGCLIALRGQTFRDFEILVVDNASQDSSLELLARDYAEARVIRLDRNYGFAGACNAGLREGRGEFLALLNTDTEAAPDWLAEVVAAFGRHPAAGGGQPTPGASSGTGRAVSPLVSSSASSASTR